MQEQLHSPRVSIKLTKLSETMDYFSSMFEAYPDVFTAGMANPNGMDDLYIQYASSEPSTYLQY